MKRIICLLITAAILLGACAAFPACAGAEENQQPAEPQIEANAEENQPAEPQEAEPQEARSEPEGPQNKGQQGQETPQQEAPQSQAGGEGHAVKEITRDDGTVEVWEFVGVFGSRDELLEKAGLKEPGEAKGEGGTEDVTGAVEEQKGGGTVKAGKTTFRVEIGTPEIGLSWSSRSQSQKKRMETAIQDTEKKDDNGPAVDAEENQDGENNSGRMSMRKIKYQMKTHFIGWGRSRKRRLKEIREKTVDAGEVKVIFLQENRGSGR